MDKRVGFVCFGEVNTPIERLQMKHDEALGVLTAMGYDLLDAGLVIDDEKYATADAAAERASKPISSSPLPSRRH